MSHLTNRSFWQSFWESKTGLITNVPSDYMFSDILARFRKERTIRSAIELGGFPGYYSVFLKKYLELDTTLLDYYIHPGIISSLLEKNGIKPDDIEIIEADLFSYQPKDQYDLVVSFGLIEHFENTEEIIRQHLKFLKPDGTLFITLPNFRGVNGWLQKTADRENYNKHFIGCMDPDFLHRIAVNLGLKDVRSDYYGKFSVWLENKQQKSISVRALAKLLWFTGKAVTSIIPIKTPALSPYITLEAKK